MPNEVRLTAERLPTLTARVGLQSSVGSPMNHKVGAVAEGLPTLRALIGFLSCVGSLMHREVRALAEGPPALSTDILSLSSLNPLVRCRTRALTTIFSRFLVTCSWECLTIFNCLRFEASGLSPHFLLCGTSQWPFESSFTFQVLTSLARPQWSSLESMRLDVSEMILWNQHLLSASFTT